LGISAALTGDNTKSNSEKINPGKHFKRQLFSVTKEVEGWLSHSLSTMVLHSQLFWLGEYCSSDRSNLEGRDLRFFCRVPEFWKQFQENTRLNPEKINFGKDLKRQL
jgi:hypothetical protein